MPKNRQKLPNNPYSSQKVSTCAMSIWIPTT
jgi:hypothetical protein